MAEDLPRLPLSRADLDRAAHHRADPGWLEVAWARPGTRVFAVAHGKVPVRWADAGPHLVFTDPGRAPEGERYFLGVDAEDTAYFAVGTDDVPEGGAGIREAGAELGDRDAGLLVHAVALDNWHRTHPFCSRCGGPTAAEAAGHVRRCGRDGSEHYPRTDPAVIMSVVDDADRILLGHQASWPEGRFSTLAGFVEPGESLEQAVRREVLEETGVRVGAADYLGSQSWPFPSSLMLGFVGHAVSTEIHEDGVEISAARWFTRAELADAVRGGELLLPGAVSIARRLIEHWYGEPLADRQDQL
jgi:NAD+ diphosphatase